MAPQECFVSSLLDARFGARRNITGVTASRVLVDATASAAASAAFARAPAASAAPAVFLHPLLFTVMRESL